MNKNLPTYEVEQQAGEVSTLYTIAWVMSNQGNFRIKGMEDAVQRRLKELRGRGIKYIVRIVRYLNQRGVKRRSVLTYTSNDKVCVFAPHRNKFFKQPHYRLMRFNENPDPTKFSTPKILMKFKRLPNRYLKKYDTFL